MKNSSLTYVPPDEILDKHFEDLLFTFDFKKLLRPHLDPQFKGYGSSGQVHVIRFRRMPGTDIPHIDYKYWHQSPAWLPQTGSLRILKTRPSLSDVSTVTMSPYIKAVMTKLPALQQRVLRFLQERKKIGLVSDEDINHWISHFKAIPAQPWQTFPFRFPLSSAEVDPSNFSSSSSSCAFALPSLPPGVKDAKRRDIMEHVRGELESELVQPAAKEEGREGT